MGCNRFLPARASAPTVGWPPGAGLEWSLGVIEQGAGGEEKRRGGREEGEDDDDDGKATAEDGRTRTDAANLSDGRTDGRREGRREGGELAIVFQ